MNMKQFKNVLLQVVPDPYRGETVKAYIVLKEGATVTEEELDNYCRENLAAFKVQEYMNSEKNSENSSRKNFTTNINRRRKRKQKQKQYKVNDELLDR